MSRQDVQFTVSANTLYICLYNQTTITVIPVACFNTFTLPITANRDNVLVGQHNGYTGTVSQSTSSYTGGSQHGNELHLPYGPR